MQNLLQKLISEEHQVINKEILCPVITGDKVVTRINGIIMSFKPIPSNFVGWGIFRIKDYKSAIFVEEPSIRQKRLYLEQFPKTQLIICSHNENMTVGAKLHNDGRYNFDATSLFFPNNISLFDVIDVRDLNGRFYYEKHSSRYRAYVDEAKKYFAEETEPSKVKIWNPFLTAYKFAYDELIKVKELTIEQKVKQAIYRAGGKYRGFTDRGETLTVQFTINGETFTPTVNSKTLMLESAGICLSGGDRAFDLQSFVHIAREGLDRNDIVRGDYIRTYGDRSADYRR